MATRQPITISEQYISKTDFCTHWKVSPHKLQDLIEAGLLGGIVISGILYIDVSKSAVLRAALAYKSANKAHYATGRGNPFTPKYKNAEEAKFELDYLASMET